MTEGRVQSPCPDCGYQRDTPNHVHGCAAGRTHSPEARAEAAAAIQAQRAARGRKPRPKVVLPGVSAHVTRRQPR